jgi:hypothetical protein
MRELDDKTFSFLLLSYGSDRRQSSEDAMRQLGLDESRSTARMSVHRVLGEQFKTVSRATMGVHTHSNRVRGKEMSGGKDDRHSEKGITYNNVLFRSSGSRATYPESNSPRGLTPRHKL